MITDSTRYHEWNPFITSIEGKLDEGQKISVVVCPPDSSDFRFRPRVLKSQPAEELRWRGSLIADFLFSGEHFFKLVPVEGGRTRFQHGEDFKGVLLKLMGRQLSATARGFALMNLALKRRAEAIAVA